MGGASPDYQYLLFCVDIQTDDTRGLIVRILFGKLSSGHRTGKGQLLFQSPKKAVSKNAQTTSHLHSSHMLVMFKILQVRLQQYVNHELPDVHPGF